MTSGKRIDTYRRCLGNASEAKGLVYTSLPVCGLESVQVSVKSPSDCMAMEAGASSDVVSSMTALPRLLPCVAKMTGAKGR